MRKSPLKKIGKRGKRNLEANRILKAKYQERGIVKCELHLEGCLLDNYLSFAHRKKRSAYYQSPESLSDFNETILACTPCHQKIENNPELTKKAFHDLRESVRLAENL